MCVCALVSEYMDILSLWWRGRNLEAAWKPCFDSVRLLRPRECAASSIKTAALTHSEVGDHWVEGHVPADLIYRLINEDPDDVRGLAVAGMPIGSPGMEGPGAQTYVVLVFALGPTVI